MKQLDERAVPSLSVKRRQVVGYDHHPPSRVFVKTVDTTSDPGTANQISLRSAQWLDNNGNRTQSSQFDWNNTTTPKRVMNFTYLAPGSAHGLAGFLNLLSSVTVQEGPMQQVLQELTYDATSVFPHQTLTPCATDLRNHAALTHCQPYDSGLLRGNATTIVANGKTTNFQYDRQGNVVRTWGASPEVQESYSTATNYMMPDVITPNSTSQLATSFTFDNAMRPTTATAPNSAVAQTWYDSFGRVEKTQSPSGAYTHHYQDYLGRYHGTRTTPDSSPVASNGVFTTNRFDGLGRTVRVESGGGAGPVLSVVLTEYGPCACSPMGKVKRVSLPHAPGETPKWTTYTYDALGRTLSVSLPDGAGSTTYAYAKDAVTITDAAGKWKRYETNGLGPFVWIPVPWIVIDILGRTPVDGAVNP
jgi:YD repeat-containing protein